MNVTETANVKFLEIQHAKGTIKKPFPCSLGFFFAIVEKHHRLPNKEMIGSLQGFHSTYQLKILMQFCVFLRRQIDSFFAVKKLFQCRTLLDQICRLCSHLLIFRVVLFQMLNYPAFCLLGQCSSEPQVIKFLQRHNKISLLKFSFQLHDYTRSRGNSNSSDVLKIRGGDWGL